MESVLLSLSSTAPSVASVSSSHKQAYVLTSPFNSRRCQSRRKAVSTAHDPEHPVKPTHHSASGQLQVQLLRPKLTGEVCIRYTSFCLSFAPLHFFTICYYKVMLCISVLKRRCCCQSQETDPNAVMQGEQVLGDDLSKKRGKKGRQGSKPGSQKTCKLVRQGLLQNIRKRQKLAHWNLHDEHKTRLTIRLNNQHLN